jgi:L-asparaginase II
MQVCTGEQAGFLSVRVYAETMLVSYVRNDGSVLREVTVHRQQPTGVPPLAVT